ncbi:DUF917 domain-containing protein [Patescibacteria group bacterium]|nr:DUF917 domain-containing protein [Patescibacteria group bacterium]
MYYCSTQQLKDIFLGAALLATGGGCPYAEKCNSLIELPKENFPIYEAKDFHPGQMLCTVYAVGPASLRNAQFSDLLTKGIDIAREYAKNKLAGIFVGELGVEHLAMSIAHQTGLKLLDADGTGGRAVPEIMQDLFPLHGRSTTPAIILDTKGNIFIKEDMDPKSLEYFVRSIAKETNSLVVVIDHFMETHDIPILSCGNLKRSLEIGNSINILGIKGLKNHNIDLIDIAKITDIKQEAKDDFLISKVVLQGSSAVYEDLIQNEHLILLRDNRPIITCPHLIILCDLNGFPIHNSDLNNYLSQKVAILACKSIPCWESEKGYELFGPSAFGWDYSIAYNPNHKN